MSYRARKFNLYHRYDDCEPYTNNAQPFVPQPLSKPVACDPRTYAIQCGTNPETDIHPKTAKIKGIFVDIANGIKNIGNLANTIIRNPYVQLGTRLIGDHISPGAGTMASDTMMAYSKFQDVAYSDPRGAIHEMGSILGTPETAKTGDGAVKSDSGSGFWGLFKKPAGSVNTSDNAQQLPAEKCVDVKNSADCDFGVGPDVLRLPPPIQLPHEAPPTVDMKPNLQLAPDGKMVIARPEQNMNKMDIGPRQIVQPQDVMLTRRNAYL